MTRSWERGRARAGAAAAVLVLVAVAAGCGGSHRAKSATVPTTIAAATPAEQRAEVKSAWERFFAGSTSAAEKTTLLEHGAVLAKQINAQAASALAKQSSAKVARVTLVGTSQATVLYTIYLAGKPALEHQRGTAVKVAGTWKVGLRSFCRLLALQGTTPPACKRAG
jgi:hypothetical protein